MNDKKLAFCLDLDDVVFSFLGTFIDSFYEETGKIININDLVDYNLSDELKDFLHKKEREGIYAYLPLEFGAIQFIKKLESLGVTLIFITARPVTYRRDTELAFYSKGLNSSNLYFNKRKHELILDLKSEYDILGFIDDRASTVIRVYEKCNLPFTFLVDKPHNRLVDINSYDIIKVNNLMDVWSHIVNRIK